MLLLWFMVLLWVSRNNGSEDNWPGANWSYWALFEARSENMVAHESSRLAPAGELISELSICDCMSEMEADEIFMWLTPVVIYWSGIC